MGNDGDAGAGADVWSFEEAFELTGHGRYNRLVLVACCIISLSVALDMFGFSLVVAAASCDLRLTITQTGWLVGSPFSGLLFAYLWGYYADARGRRRALLLSTSVGFLFGLLNSFAVNWQMMLVAKILGCSFSTASYTLTMTYLGECTRSKNRSQYLIIMNSMNLGCEVVSFGLAYLILPLAFSLQMPWLSIHFTPWRLLNLVFSLPLGLGAILLLYLSESPKFLADKGRNVLGVLTRIYRLNGGKEGNYPVKEVKLSTMRCDKAPFCQSVVRQSLPLFTRPLLWRTLQLFYLISLICAINNTSVMWFPTMVDIVFKAASSEQTTDLSFCGSIKNATAAQYERNSGKTCSGTISDETIYSGLLTSLVITALNLVVAMFAAWRRLVLMAALGVAAVSCLAVALLNSPILSVIFFALIQTTAIGIGSVASYFVYFYPTSCSGLATSLGFMLARTTSLTAVVLIGTAIVDHCRVIFYVYATFGLSAVCVASLLPSDNIAK